MFGEAFKRKFALTDQGVANVKKGTFWTVIVNFIDFAGIGILFMLMKQLMATLLGGAPSPELLPYVGGIIVFLVVSFVAHKMQYKNTYGTVYGEVGKIRISLAERLRKLPLSFFAGRDLADLAETIMSDVDRLEHVWSHVLGYLYGSYISTAVVAVALIAFDWRMGIAVMWGVPVAFGLLFGLRKVFAKSTRRSRADALIVSDGIQEMLDTAREIRATNQVERHLGELEAKIDTSEQSTAFAELRVGLVVNAASVIMRLGVATTIILGVSLMLAGQIDFLVFFMYLLTVSRIYAPFDQALALIAELFISEVSAERLQAIYDEPVAEGVDTFAPDGHDIVFNSVSFAYKAKSAHGEKNIQEEDPSSVLNNVSFTAKEGEVTALVGPSGSGKSTCARLTARLWDASSGTICVGGVNIADIDPEVLLTDYAMVFQDVTLFDDTVMANIRIGRKDATDEEVLAAARAANCDEFIDKLADGYQTMIGENGSRLSGGERQRISIARALLKDAPIVLMDEATASLDVENETKVQEALTRLLAGKTVLVIAHRMRTVENADKIVVLADGKVAEEGSPAELRAKEGGLFRHMSKLQQQSSGWAL
ncbi:ABC transporter ATP-binding protein [Lancefieldella rimae]